jgi:hypothetical protein
VNEQIVEDWVTTPAAEALALFEVRERALAADLDVVLNDLFNRRIAVNNLVRALETEPPPDRPRILGIKLLTPADLFEGLGLLGEELRSRLAYANPDFGLTPEERKNVLATIRAIVDQASNTSEFENAIDRARDLRQKAALTDAGVAANEALILHVIVTLRLHLATLIHVDHLADISESPRTEFLAEWHLLIDVTQPIVEAASTGDHASVLARWTALMPNLEPTMRQLTEWSENQRVVVNVMRAFGLAGAAMSVLQLGIAVFGPVGGGLGPGGRTGGMATTAGVLRATRAPTSVDWAVTAVAAVAAAAGGGTPPPAPGPSNASGGGDGSSPPPWDDPNLPPWLRALWRERLRAHPYLATDLTITAKRRQFDVLGIFDEMNATDGSEWSYTVRDRRTGITAQIDGWTGEGGLNDWLGRQRLVEVKSDQGFRTLSKTDPVPRDYDLLDEVRGTPDRVMDVLERRRTAIGEFRQERWSEQMLRHAQLASDNGMVAEWRCTGPQGLKVAHGLVDRLGLRGQVFVIDAADLAAP